MQMAADVWCTSCGTALRASAKFCDECGAPTVVSRDKARFKQVTVLFADVVRSMDIAAAVDIERFREIMTELVQRCAAVVQRCGGTPEYNGDGVMALFGAPIALEDHAFRGCLAALAIQEEADRFAAELQHRDAITLRLRVGLNSGRVIAGDIGSGSLGYVATGEPVGIAQRMESVAPPGGVMLSESTARLVEHSVVLADPEWVRFKGADEPVRARRLVAISPRDGRAGLVQSTLVGRRWEMAALDAQVDRANSGRGGVVNVVGPPGIGKSRVAREVAALATGRGVDVVWTFCESHARHIPFQVVARMLRGGLGMADLHGDAARARLETQLPDADPQDLLLLADLLGIAEPEIGVPPIDPDARRRRLTALVNTASLARTESALYVIEDAHWIDEVSESMLVDFLKVVLRTPSMVLITSRPDYDGPLTRVHGAQTITLAPLGDSDTSMLVQELLGTDPSVSELAVNIVERAAGNPFFAEEIVRELVQRGTLVGERGGYVSDADAAEVAVPVTVQAAIGARIDRLDDRAKQTLNAASVIGAQFGVDSFEALGVDPVFDSLLTAELIDQVQFTPTAGYAFHHPLIRAVAYESQLRSDRAQWHRRLAVAIQEGAPDSVDENAAAIAEHLRAADDLPAAYDWHMRAGAWSATRDLSASRLSWEHARKIADELPDEPGKLARRIAPRTMLCATDWRAIRESHGRFEELRELCGEAGDKVSLVIGMSGLETELLYSGRSREGAHLAAEQTALLESIGDPHATIGLSLLPLLTWFDSGGFEEMLRWTDYVVALADGDPTAGAAFGFGSPLAAALAWRGLARWWLGRAGAQQDHEAALAIAKNSDPTTLAGVVAWTCGPFYYGVRRADDVALALVEEAERTADGSNDVAMSVGRFTLGVVLLERDSEDDRNRGLHVMGQARDLFATEGAPFLVPVSDMWIARERAKRGHRDSAITVMRDAVDEIVPAGRVYYGVWAIGVLVETLLERGAEGDAAEAQSAIDQLADLLGDNHSAVGDIVRLRTQVLLARARGDVALPDLLRRYRGWAQEYDFDVDIKRAEAFTSELDDSTPAHPS